MPPPTPPLDAPPFDGSLPWKMDSQVALRPESFGALAYHFGTRRLSFLKSPRLVSVVEGLAGAPSADEACQRAGVTAEEHLSFRRALATLAASGMIVERALP
ncbi:MAG: mycofactocin biosynthesis chaperone MftB [Acidimicrobiales bacterium]